MDFYQYFINWIADPKALIALLAFILSIYNAVKARRAELKDPECKVVFVTPNEGEGLLIAAMILSNPSSLPLSVIDVEFEIGGIKYRSEYFGRNFYRTKSKDNPGNLREIASSDFPINIPKYLSNMVFVILSKEDPKVEDEFLLKLNRTSANICFTTTTKTIRIKTDIPIFSGEDAMKELERY